jgi:hypothetical protein
MRKNVIGMAALALALVVIGASQSHAALRRGCSSCGTACATCTVAPAPATAAGPAPAPAQPAEAKPAESKPAVAATTTAPARGRFFARSTSRRFARR